MGLSQCLTLCDDTRRTARCSLFWLHRRDQVANRASACTQQRRGEVHLSSLTRIDSLSLSGGAAYTDVSYSVLPSSACDGKWNFQHGLFSTSRCCAGSLVLPH